MSLGNPLDTLYENIKRFVKYYHPHDEKLIGSIAEAFLIFNNSVIVSTKQSEEGE